MTTDDLNFGERVEVRGHAYPAAAGPLVQADDGRSYYLLGASDWSTDMIGKRVVVSGTLRLRPAQVKTLPPDQEQSHGLPDDTLVIDDAQWRPAE
jgi:hypothetical protein